MKKGDFVKQVAEKAETSREAAARVIEAIFDATSGAISEAVRAGENVAIPGFGRFRSKTRAARKGRNPQTGQEIDIPERTVVQFSSGKGLQDALAGKASGGARKSSTAKKASGATAKKSAGAAAKKSTGGAAAKKSGGGTGTKTASGGTTAKKSGGGTTAKKSGGSATAKKSGAAKKSGGTGR